MALNAASHNASKKPSLVAPLSPPSQTSLLPSDLTKHTHSRRAHRLCIRPAPARARRHHQLDPKGRDEGLDGPERAGGGSAGQRRGSDCDGRGGQGEDRGGEWEGSELKHR